MKRIIVVASGGLDSTVLLHHVVATGAAVRSISINYGQRHSRELEFARLNSRRLGVVHQHVDLACLRDVLTGSSQTDDRIPVPEGHYEEKSMKATVVPNRNMILLSVAIGAAVAHQYDEVAYAAHSGDHAIYPDCREEFVIALNAAAQLCDWHPVQIDRPFIHLTKADIVRRGAELEVPFASTYSCYKGQPVHCGVCGTCVERREAFYIAGVPDPTAYLDSTPIQNLLGKKKTAKS